MILGLFLMSGCLLKSPPKVPSELTGAELFSKHCLRCHGKEATGSKIYNKFLPDASIINDKDGFLKIVFEGVAKTQMTSKKYDLHAEDVEKLRKYLIELKSDKRN